MGVDFYQTAGGHRFVEGTVPSLVRAVTRLAKALERANFLKVKDLEMRLKEANPLLVANADGSFGLTDTDGEEMGDDVTEKGAEGEVGT